MTENSFDHVIIATSYWGGTLEVSSFKTHRPFLNRKVAWTFAGISRDIIIFVSVLDCYVGY